MRIAATATGLMVLCALTACSGKSGGNGTTSAASVKPSATTTSAPSTAPSHAHAPGGIIVSYCPSPATGIRNVEFVNPSDGSVTQTRFFVMEPMKYHSIGDCNSNLVGAKLQSAFNGDYTEIAASDGMWHTGVIRASHSMQDMTTKFQDMATGLGGKPPVSTIQQSAGAFGPDGQLYFVQKESELDDAKLMAVNPNSGAPKAATVKVNLQGFDPTEEANHLFFTPGNKTPQTDEMLYEVFSSDGSQFIRAGDGTITYGKTGTDGTTTEPNYGHTLLPFAYAGPGKFYGQTDEGVILANINGKTVNERTLTTTDGKIIAYIEETDTARTLYTVSTSGGPRHKVMDLDRTVLGAGLLGWNSGK